MLEDASGFPGITIARSMLINAHNIFSTARLSNGLFRFHSARMTFTMDWNFDGKFWEWRVKRGCGSLQGVHSSLSWEEWRDGASVINSHSATVRVWKPGARTRSARPGGVSPIPPNRVDGMFEKFYTIQTRNIIHCLQFHCTDRMKDVAELL